MLNNCKTFTVKTALFTVNSYESKCFTKPELLLAYKLTSKRLTFAKILYVKIYSIYSIFFCFYTVIYIHYSTVNKVVPIQSSSTKRFILEPSDGIRIHL